jgi:type IV pilus assembly protein PilM
MNGGEPSRLICEPLPDNLVKDGRVVSPETLSDVLRGALRKNRVSAKDCALALSQDETFTRRVTMPYMTTDQLELNLPYEFHDYIQNDKDKYFYDYAVIGTGGGEDGKPAALDLLAAAAPRETIGEYRDMLKKAGLRLRTAMPVCFALRNIIGAYEDAHRDAHPNEYCIVDMGYRSIKMHIFKGSVWDTTRTLDYGGASMDALIADHLSVDQHVASGYKLTDCEGVNELEACRELYSRIAVEIMRAVNFYGFNNPDSSLQDIYFCGGLAEVKPLMDAVRASVGRNIHTVGELFPPLADEKQGGLFAIAAGVAMQ